MFGREAVRQQLEQAQRGRGRVGPARRQAWDVPRRIPAARQPLVCALGRLLGVPLHSLQSLTKRSSIPSAMLTLLGCFNLLNKPYA